MSGVTEVQVFSHYLFRSEEHDGPAAQYAIISTTGGRMGEDGDSGSPVALEDGRVGGMFIGSGEGVLEADGSTFYYGFMIPVQCAFDRIRQVLGRNLDIPGVHDLSHKDARDSYHFERTGRHRQRQ
jgi:hypothetical protein